MLEELLPILRELSPEIIKILESVAALALVALIYKLASNYVSRVGDRLELDDHIRNSIRLVIRVVTIVVGATIIFRINNLPTEWFVGGSALIGAVVGFGSSQTINNIAAGFYVILSRPFRVKDYVKIGDVEGQIEEISINYTKLYTPSFNLLLIPNTQVMNNRVLNCTHEGHIKYLFSINVPHTEISNDDFEENCLKPAVDDFMERYNGVISRRPEYLFESSGNFGRSYKIRIFIPKGEAKLLYELQPELYEMVISYWDKEKKKNT